MSRHMCAALHKLWTLLLGLLGSGCVAAAVWLQMAHFNVVLINKHTALLQPPVTRRCNVNYHNKINVNFLTVVSKRTHVAVVLCLSMSSLLQWASQTPNTLVLSLAWLPSSTSWHSMLLLRHPTPHLPLYSVIFKSSSLSDVCIFNTTLCQTLHPYLCWRGDVANLTP